MIEKSFLDAIPGILDYEIYGLITVVLLINSFLLMYVIKKESLKPGVIQIIKLFIFVSIAMVISFLIFLYFNKPVQQIPPAQKEWVIHGDIELRDNQNQTLDRITKDACGESLETASDIEDFLKANLKISMLPNLPATSFASDNFSIEISGDLSKGISTMFFGINGFHCISDNCRLELNTSNYKPELKMIFVRDQPNEGECSSLRAP